MACSSVPRSRLPVSGHNIAKRLPSMQTYCRFRSRHHRRDFLVVQAGSMQLMSMPLFESRDVCHPTSTGVLNIFEPRYLQMLSQHSRFVHILSPAVVSRIPELARDALEGGVPRVGVLVDVRSVQDDGQTKLVSYEGVRRVRLLMLQADELPYRVAAVEPHDDHDEGRQAALPEREVYTALKEVHVMQSELVGSDDAPQPALPAAVERWAPPDGQAVPAPADAAQYLKQAGHALAAQQVAMWQRSGWQQAAGRRRVANPYAEIAEEVGCSRRAEMFSFAAAGVLDMGTPERIALLLTQSTLGRLEYILAAVRPYLQQLRTAVAMQRALPRD